jgi:periplasmic protein TonB
MFVDSMLEDSWAQRSRRSWMTLLSFGMQALVTGVLLLLPLIRPEGLLVYHRLSTPISFGRVPQPLEVHSVTGAATLLHSNFAGHHLMMPSRIPALVMRVSDDALPRDFGPAGPYIPGAPGQGVRDGLPNFGGTGTSPILQPPPLGGSHPIRVSNMNEGSLLLRVQPEYPALARSARVQGTVLLSAIISKDGMIQNLRVLSGHPMLVRAAIEAVKRWRYRPYILNNEPVEVETQISVNFSLSGS